MPVTPADLHRAQHALAAALDGSGPPVEFTEDGRVLPRPEASDPARGGSARVVAVVRTSGSTGTPKQTLLTRDALAASAAATAARIGGQGQWLLAVGLHYVAGLAVLSAGGLPVVERYLGLILYASVALSLPTLVAIAVGIVRHRPNSWLGRIFAAARDNQARVSRGAGYLVTVLLILIGALHL